MTNYEQFQNAKEQFEKFKTFPIFLPLNMHNYLIHLENDLIYDIQRRTINS